MTETVEVASAVKRDAAEPMIVDLRQQIDEVDAEIIRLVLMRTNLSKQMCTARQIAGSPKFTYSDELAMLARYRVLGESGTELGLLLLRRERRTLAPS
ncbi:chorismate mutase [Lentzea sp. NPDC004782]|uniref:chorismate mutase n=1 Tax=Lentzea sp. NPDC004782 TaxID=3154458 RepID=UPI0033ABC4E9